MFDKVVWCIFIMLLFFVIAYRELRDSSICIFIEYLLSWWVWLLIRTQCFFLPTIFLSTTLRLLTSLQIFSHHMIPTIFLIVLAVRHNAWLPVSASTSAPFMRWTNILKLFFLFALLVKLLNYFVNDSYQRLTWL